MRTKKQIKEHQGVLSGRDLYLGLKMLREPKRYFTTLDICRLTGCVSARDRIRKLKADGAKIGPAKLLRVNPNGSRVYGWRIG